MKTNKSKTNTMKAFISLSTQSIELKGEAEEIAKVLKQSGITDCESEHDNLFGITTTTPDVQDMKNDGAV